MDTDDKVLLTLWALLIIVAMALAILWTSGLFDVL